MHQVTNGFRDPQGKKALLVVIPGEIVKWLWNDIMIQKGIKCVEILLPLCGSNRSWIGGAILLQVSPRSVSTQLTSWHLLQVWTSPSDMRNLRGKLASALLLKSPCSLSKAKTKRTSSELSVYQYVSKHFIHFRRNNWYIYIFYYNYVSAPFSI